MQFLRTLFWIVLAVLIALFSYNNWTPVTVSLWSGLQLDSKLPVLLLLAFLLGLLPMLLLYQTTRWRLRRRLESAERSLAELRGPPPVEPAFTTPPSIPPGSVPTAVPPGVS
jgi:putative membrane protein